MQNLFSYPLPIEDISVREKKFNLTAGKEELAYIGEILKVSDIRAFQAEIYVQSDRETHLITVKGRAEAELELQSVISLENFWKKHCAEFELVFDPSADPGRKRETDGDFREDLPDPVENGQIDLAAVAIEQIALTMDDYPRQEGEVFVFKSEFTEDEAEKAAKNPFSVLKKLKK